MAEPPNAPSVSFADSSPALRWSISALGSSTAKRGRWLAEGETEGAFGA
jgi:hypothetical protein